VIGGNILIDSQITALCIPVASMSYVFMLILGGNRYDILHLMVAIYMQLSKRANACGIINGRKTTWTELSPKSRMEGKGWEATHNVTEVMHWNNESTASLSIIRSSSTNYYMFSHILTTIFVVFPVIGILANSNVLPQDSLKSDC